MSRAAASGPSAVRELTAAVGRSAPVLHLLLLPLQLSRLPLQLLLLLDQLGLPGSRRRLDDNNILLRQFQLSYFIFPIVRNRLEEGHFSTCATHLWVLLHRGLQDGGLR